MSNKDLPAKRDGQSWAKAREIVAKATYQVNLNQGNTTYSEADKIHDKAADALERLIESECAAREQATLQATVCHKHGWNTSCPDIAERLKSNQEGEADV